MSTFYNTTLAFAGATGWLVGHAKKSSLGGQFVPFRRLALPAALATLTKALRGGADATGNAHRWAAHE